MGAKLFFLMENKKLKPFETYRNVHIYHNIVLLDKWIILSKYMWVEMENKLISLNISWQVCAVVDILFFVEKRPK